MVLRAREGRVRARLAIENARLYENAQELAAIKERNRLARDLHDSVKQKTFAALAQIGASRRLVTSQPERARAYIDEAENLVHGGFIEGMSHVMNWEVISTSTRCILACTRRRRSMSASARTSCCGA